jgi:hypothetical protein
MMMPNDIYLFDGAFVKLAVIRPDDCCWRLRDIEHEAV